VKFVVAAAVAAAAAVATVLKSIRNQDYCGRQKGSSTQQKTEHVGPLKF